MEVIESYSQKPGFVCLTCLEKITENNDVFIETIPISDEFYGEGVIWFFITDDQYNGTLRFVVEQ